ncbi:MULTISPECIES: DUF6471 domain-containing protein [Burkholderia cepacia complex]|uniref:DUF6471 domain-containing protein n=1 Tax=Burkholderia cepacia complex TaxID=87882 RepID=UPI001E5EA586|nr:MULTISPECIES: DUF6471 domain-containing protein [Burkholderia cepacia complex]MDN7681586.1 DUF6471 domain-containing protein [Burkholderia cenocepacia]
MSPKDHMQESPYAQWEGRARELVVSTMVQRDLSYKDLARLLESYGIKESADQINRKINRKRFSAAFLLACLAAMGVETVPVF